ncbi:MAG: AAA-like domain-containing protein [Verrucomicrobia bacterium]|nr:AAA-like domain-containing protein [Verrucomicrobiota bacterium]
MSTSDTAFYVIGGTLRHDAPSYVERQADNDLLAGLLNGEFCSVLTSRQMGKSSLMVRTASKLRGQGAKVVVLDLTAIGQNLTPEQWYDGLLVRLGRQLGLEDQVEEFWRTENRLSPVQGFMTALHDVALAQSNESLVLFVDEIDVVRSLPFATDEFFSAIRECYNRRVQDPEFNRLTFCLLGVATPSELIRNPRTTPFNIGLRVELTDFTEAEALPLAARLDGNSSNARAMLERILHWTNGHPYLTQRLCRAVWEERARCGSEHAPSAAWPCIDELCERLFLSARAREQDDNLLFVRERMLRSEADLARLLNLYEQVRNQRVIPDDEGNEFINQLRLSGIVSASNGCLRVRNRIYAHVFDPEWIRTNKPDAELETPDGRRLRIESSCSIGRASPNDLALPDAKVSRRHALIQAQKQHEFWLVDLGSSNGTYVNGRRVTQPVLLKPSDQIEIGPFRLVFHQSRTPAHELGDITICEQTLHSDTTILKRTH